MIEITFLGGARSVTGSRFLVRAGGGTLLVDCGLFQERELRSRNWEDFPFPPRQIDAVVLTHAHLDHCGYLPKLVREGFAGDIYCTPPTAEVVKIALLDSAKIHQEDAAYKKRRHQKEGRQGPYPEVPLYTVADAEAVFPHLVTVPYRKEVAVSPRVKLTFRDAGHIIGSALAELKIKDEGDPQSLLFSGDLGRKQNPLLASPEPVEETDFLFLESTYGDRLHESAPAALDKLRSVIVETAERGGKVVIPTFAIERAQELLYFIKQLLEAGDIPALDCFIDSPMAIDITGIYNSFPDYLNGDSRNQFSGGGSPFSFPLLNMTRETKDSIAINSHQGPAIIMAGSGMCTGGRIKHHLVQQISRPETTILFVGYQARGTLGRILLERPQKVRILGQDRLIRARIEQINGFSAHADRDEIVNWLGRITRAPKRVFVVHGEEKSSLALAETIQNRFDWETVVPAYQEIHILQNR